MSWPAADALIIAPATFNTINKLALEIADTYALAAPMTGGSRGHAVPDGLRNFRGSALSVRWRRWFDKAAFIGSDG